MEYFNLVALHFPIICASYSISHPNFSPITLSRSVIAGVSHLSQVLEIPMPDYFSWKEKNLIFPNLKTEGQTTVAYSGLQKSNLAIMSLVPRTCHWHAHQYAYTDPFLPAAHHLTSQLHTCFTSYSSPWKDTAEVHAALCTTTFTECIIDTLTVFRKCDFLTANECCRSV